jgi:hypothetical protein
MPSEDKEATIPCDLLLSFVLSIQSLHCQNMHYPTTIYQAKGKKVGHHSIAQPSKKINIFFATNMFICTGAIA